MRTIGTFLLIRSYGETLVAPPAAVGETLTEATAKTPDALPRVLVALTTVIIIGQILAKLFAQLRQPPVIGEVVAGMVLGPSLLGPEISASVLPPAVASVLGVIAQLGVILYMFTVGLELTVGLLKHRAHATVASSHASILVSFLLGAVIPHDSAVARLFSRQLEHVVPVLLLPAFFALTGMRTRVDLVSSPGQCLICGLIILVATLGKFSGTLVAARLTGMGWRHAPALGTLMNTRGLMELIVLNIGLALKVLSPTLFSMMVVMALVTTMATSPVLSALRLQTVAGRELDGLSTPPHAQQDEHPNGPANT